MKKKLLLLTVMVLLMFSMTGCRKPFDTPEIVTIQPSQTAFLVPLTGDSTQQANMDSMEFLQEAKVPTKQVTIPHRWLQTGRNTLGIFPNGEWIKSASLILVERKPVSREWTSDSSTGTSASNQGVVTESKDSIGFVVGVSISSQIDESNAVKFLYRYNNKPLSSIMDEEIRTRVESKINEECGKRPLEQVMTEKSEILASVREDVIPYFEERGITITALGLKGQFDYVDSEIQKSINKKFTAEKEEQAQTSINRMNVEKADADKKVIEAQKAIMKEKLELMELENDKLWIQKWDGKMPQYMMGSESSMLISMPQQ